MVYSFVVAAILALIINKTIGFRVSEEDEVTGVDETEHAEIGLRLLDPAASTGLSHGVVGPRAANPHRPSRPPRAPERRAEP